MSDDTSLAADLSAALGDTSTQSEPSIDSTVTVEGSAPEGAATTAPAENAAAQPSTEPEPGPIPFPVHKTALDNARKKAVEEWEQQYGWAKQVDRQAIEQAQRIGQFYSQDRAGFIRQVLVDAVNDPTLAPMVRSEAARVLGTRSAASEPQQEPQPDIPIQLEDGRVVRVYSEEQAAKREAWLQQRFMAQAEQKFKPALVAAQKLQRAEMEAQADRFATGVNADVSQLPGMDPKTDHANRIAVRDLLASWLPQLPPERADDPVVLEALTHKAWRQVVLPKLDLAANRKVLTNIHSQAQASVVNPATAGTAAPKSVDEMSTAEYMRHLMAQGA